MTDVVTLKRCPKCGLEKPLEDYYKNKHKPDGVEQYCKKCSKEYRKTVRDPDKARERTKAWHKANPDKVLAIHHRREQRKRDNYVEDVDPTEVYRRSDGKCGICGFAVPFNEMAVDHILPLAQGGEHSYANTQASHEDCNRAKGGLTVEED